jgi:hypothetical protein
MQSKSVRCVSRAYATSLFLFPVKRVAHLINIVWQSAVPPTLCTFTIALLYIISHHFHLVGLFSVCVIPLRALWSWDPCYVTTYKKFPNRHSLLCGFQRSRR